MALTLIREGGGHCGKADCFGFCPGKPAGHSILLTAQVGVLYIFGSPKEGEEEYANAT